jgi:exodeoxyribonuclease VII large subunit
VDVSDGAGSPADDEPDGAEVVWLFDPAAGPGRFEGTPMELFDRLSVAAAHAGLGEVAVRGVVVGVRRRGRVCTIELADHAPGAAAPEAVVRVVVFADALRRIDRALAADGLELVEGAEATAVGELRFDPPWGGFRVVAADVEVHASSGAVAAARAALAEALSTEGLLTRQAALVVPGRPLRVGLVAGAGTAGAEDVAALLESSGLEWQLHRRSVPMAGPDAPMAVAAAIAGLAASRPDVIVVARGGGGRAEMACWDSEPVLRAIATSPVPVWTAIGHARDAALADRVANKACATPSAAAAELVGRARDFERRRHERTVLAAHAERLRAERTRVRRAWVVAAVAVAALLVVVWLVLFG